MWYLQYTVDICSWTQRAISDFEKTRRKTQVHLPCFLFFHSGAERPIMFNILWQYTAAILPVSHFSTRNTCSLRYLTPLEG